METKKMWYQSRTLWTNFVVLIGSLLVVFGVIEVELPPETVATVLVVVNMILRVLTGKELSATK